MALLFVIRVIFDGVYFLFVRYFFTDCFYNRKHLTDFVGMVEQSCPKRTGILFVAALEI